ncbi:PhoD-like phosphatase [Seminavis robusta]|uniref:PhoD-like phosphatase n=1 Tax=Seminavis robusta TaxID=568900 RepID=A0A9N8HQF8_9STRA|nr:PhoD-like phosphatase [Seminavis robusta]CAB9521081.1 PhoD-like phosphatase [Seminavis robusta]|eukprot:Sro1162_g247850.1 PhoD-like phosphatase (448) ;mRNA; r:1845-3188
MSLWSLLVLLLLHDAVIVVAASDISHPNATLSKIAFGSCHNARKIHGHVHDNNIWKAISAESPDLFVWTGDAVYPAQRKIANTTYLKQLFHDMKTNKTIGYRQFASHVKNGIYGVYDDHDYGGNDAGVEMPDKRDRADLFMDFLQLDQSTTTSQTTLQERDGLYYSVTFGTPPEQVKLILLDTRWHRTKHCFPSLATKVPLGAGLSAATRWALAGFNVNQWWPFWDCWKAPTVLGEQQWNWLEQELTTNSQANVHIVVSSIQVLTTDPTVESWGHFPLERQRLITLLGKGISGLVLLSGDVHHAEIFNPLESQSTTTVSKSKSSFLEVTSSGLTHYCSQPFYGFMCQPVLEKYNQNRFQSSNNFYIGRNYGRIDIDWKQQTIQVVVQDENGQTVLRTGHRPFQQDTLTPEEVAQVPFCVDGHLTRPVLSVLTALVVIVVVGVRSFGR